MYEQGGDPDFWWKWMLMMATVILSVIVFNAIMRKLLNVERQKFFSYNHINEKHKKVDWTIRISTVVVLLLGFAINSTRNPTDWFWFFQPWNILLLFLISSQTAKAIMERKYAENRNRYKVTIGETVFILALFVSLYLTDFWGIV
ncbi:DUF4181 domain-containing protein [Planococcus halotolerans]|uniref:DUF4181 domain-containing protein n=1 Tax=Planococcus halotolerans TaxID=2233542 RepID=A0A365KXX7_9BACL|nr:DUF4181 domain-containing protein [Planococcus halotolerans]QHJ69124.1 DUF4181 domain-containing protein [Planococcus halotolerans]RAZ77677.1 DUF4181 domain-containing protein [Planococcus halotolerans]